MDRDKRIWYLSPCEQRRFRRAWASAQTRQNLRCSLIQAVSQEEPSDRKPDPWSLRMAGHAQLKFVVTECSKTQIRLTGLIWSKLLYWYLYVWIYERNGQHLHSWSHIAEIYIYTIWAPSSEFVSSSIQSWHILTGHAQTFRGARDLTFCLKVPLHSLLVWASSEGFGETARMRRLAWTFAALIGDKYQIRLPRSICLWNIPASGRNDYMYFVSPWHKDLE